MKIGGGTIILVCLGLYFVGIPAYEKYQLENLSLCQKMLMNFSKKYEGVLELKGLSDAEAAVEFGGLSRFIEPDMCEGAQRTAVIRVKDDLEEIKSIGGENGFESFINSIDGDQKTRLYSALDRFKESSELLAATM